MSSAEDYSSKEDEERDIDSTFYRIGGDPLYVDGNDTAHEIHGNIILGGGSKPGSRGSKTLVKIDGYLELPDLSSLRIGSGNSSKDASDEDVASTGGETKILSNKSPSSGGILTLSPDGSFTTIGSSAPGHIPFINSDGSLVFADVNEIFGSTAQKKAQEVVSSSVFNKYKVYVRKHTSQTVTTGSRQIVKGWTDQDVPDLKESPVDSSSVVKSDSPKASMFYVSKDAVMDLDTGSYVTQEDSHYNIKMDLQIEGKSSAGSVTLIVLIDGKRKREDIKPFSSNPRYPTSVQLTFKPYLSKGRTINVAVYLEGPPNAEYSIVSDSTTLSIQRSRV